MANYWLHPKTVHYQTRITSVIWPLMPEFDMNIGVPITPSAGLDINYRIGHIRYPVIPRFAYPGSKCRLAPVIASLLPSSGDRFVEPFAGRANVYFAVSQLLDYKKFWLNDLERDKFLHCLKAGNFHAIRDDHRLFEEMKQAKLDGHEDVDICYDKAKSFSGVDGTTNPHLLEPLLAFSGGTYETGGKRGKKRGGVSTTGFNFACGRAHEIMNHVPTRITGWDYREVLEQCGSNDMVYL